MKLYPYQVEAVEFISERKNSYISLHCGGGKTLTALEATKHFSRVLVICPASLCQVWADEIDKWYTNFTVYIVPTTKDIFPKTVNTPNTINFIILSYEKALTLKVYSQLFRWQYEAVIVDEAHHLKTATSKRTEALLGWQSGKPRLLTKKSVQKIILLSGTPIMNRPLEIYAPARGLVPQLLGEYKDATAFGVRYCSGYKDSFNRWVFRGASNINELADRLKTFIFRVPRDRIEKELPEITHRIIRLVCAHELVQLEQPYHKDSLRESAHVIALEGLAEIQHKMALEKAPLVVDYAKDLAESGERAIIFFWHRAVGELLFTSLKKYSPLLIDGSVPTNSRKELADKFNAGKYGIAVCQVKAAGEGLSFHTATQVIFAEVSWNPAENEQAFKRVHRRGQQNHVGVHYLVVKNSLDDYKLNKIMSKEKVINNFYNELE